MSVEIYFVEDNRFTLALSISINKTIDQCCVIKQAPPYFTSDLLLIISQQLDVLLVQFRGGPRNLTYQIIRQFNVMKQLQNDQYFTIPF